MSDFAILFRIIFRWILVAISLSAVICIYWSFVGIFTKRKAVKIIAVSLMVAMSIFLYIENKKPPGAVRMQEDVLYIKPK